MFDSNQSIALTIMKKLPLNPGFFSRTLKSALLSICTFCSFTVFAQPVVSSFSPLSGPVSSTVAIHGTGFSASAVANTVYFGAAKAVVTGASATTLTVIVPAGATNLPVTVTTGGLSGYSTRPFVVSFNSNGDTLKAGSFEKEKDFGTEETPNVICAGDWDGDGKTDFAVSSYDEFECTIYKNNSTFGNVAFALPQSFYNNLVYAFATGDINGDGKLDIIGTSYDYVLVFINTSTGGNISFASPVILQTTSGAGNTSVRVADLDRDGKPDIVVANTNTKSISIFRNQTTVGGVAFAPKIDYSVPPTDYVTNIAVTDYNMDGRPDIGIVSGGAGDAAKFYILRNISVPGTISFAARLSFATPDYPTNVVEGDMDGDGKTDITIACSNFYSVFRNTSSGNTISFAAKTDYPGFVLILSTGDVNGDAKPELLTSQYYTVSVMQNKSTTANIAFAPGIDFSTTAYLGAFIIADIDGDGKPDMTTLLNTNEIAVLRNRIGEKPVVSSFNPVKATFGDTVVITGQHLTDASTVSFGGVPASYVKVNSSTSVTAVVAEGASGSVMVTTPVDTSSLPGFTYYVPVVEQDTAVCASSLPLAWNGNNYTTAGEYTIHLTGVRGNDSIVKLVLHILSSDFKAALAASDTLVCYAGIASLRAVASHGAAPYLYSIDDGQNYQAAVTFRQHAGTYAVRVKDTLGCIAQTNSIFIRQPAAKLTLDVSASQNCNTGAGFVTASGAGGYSNYRYRINNGAYQANDTLVVAAPGIYTVTVKDSMSCNATKNVAVNPLYAALKAPRPEICPGESAMVHVDAAYGATPYQYSLDGINYQPQPDFMLPPGSYTVTVKDAAGCTYTTNSIAATVPPLPLHASITPTNVSCNSGSDGSITSLATGGYSSSPYMYSLNGSPYQASNIYSGLPAGTYKVAVRDAKRCIVAKNVVVRQSATPCAPFAATTTFESQSKTTADAAIKVFVLPNPASVEFNLQVQGGDSKKPLALKVTDVLGRTMYQTKGTVLDNYRFGRSFAAGIYIVEVLNGSKMQKIKLLKVN